MFNALLQTYINTGSTVTHVAKLKGKTAWLRLKQFSKEWATKDIQIKLKQKSKRNTIHGQNRVSRDSDIVISLVDGMNFLVF